MKKAKIARFTLLQKIALALVLAATIAYLFMAEGCTRPTTAVDVRAPYVIPDTVLKTLSIDSVSYSPLSTSIKFNGIVDVDPDKVVNIFPLISGNVQGVNAELGDYVHAGQVLGTVKSPEVAGYAAGLTTAEQNVRLTASQLSRAKEMAKGGLASQVDVTSAEVAYQQALAARAQAQQVLSINGNSRGGAYLIKSPIDGYVIAKNVTNGVAIRTDNSSPLFTVSNLKTVWVLANVYEANIGKVHQGDAVDVTTITYPDRLFHGKVDKLMNVLDPSNRVMKMRVVLPNPDYVLKPQMFATVTVNNRTEGSALSVPAGALVFDNSQYYVIIYHSPKDVQLRQVELISNNGTTAYIRSGVSQGERVISSNAILIYGALNS